MVVQQSSDKLTLRSLFQRFRIKILFTWFLVLGEAALLLLFPLFMGIAIDDYLAGTYRGLLGLSTVAFLVLAVGAGRRFYDTRIYSRIYAIISPELVEKEKQRDASVSVISARASLATEFVEYLENYFPEMINSFIGLFGTLVIIAFLNLNVFLACLAATALIIILYGLTSKKTYRLNSGYNSELEKQVEVLSGDDRPGIAAHFKRVANWNIRLSDLETANFSLSWLFLMGVLVYAIVATIESGITSHGQVLAILMYVFNYIETIVAIPFFYQQFVRLREISHRLEGEAQE